MIAMGLGGLSLERVYAVEVGTGQSAGMMDTFL